MIVGMDTNSFGFAAHTDDSQYFVSNAPKKVDVEERRVQTYRESKELFLDLLIGTTTRESHVFCEEPLALKNGKTTRLLGLAAGAIWAAHVEVCVTNRVDSYWHWVDVASWKKRIVGNGNASKEMIADFVVNSPLFINFLDRRRKPHDVWTHEKVPDLYDAWCVLQYGRWFIDNKEA